MTASRQKIRHEVKREVLAGLDRKHLVTLTFSLKDSQERLHWEHDAEFEFHGEMYDVVESTASGDSVTYLCYPDKKETALNDHIRKLVSYYLVNQPQNRENSQRVMHFFKALFVHEPFQSITGASAKGQIIFSLVCKDLKTRPVETPVPPPRRVI